MKNQRDWAAMPDNKTIELTAGALRKNGFDVIICDTKEEARMILLSRMPANAEVMDMTSMTLAAMGIPETVHQNYDSARVKIEKLDKATAANERRRFGAAPEFAIGSVHAITEEGSVFIASKTGSQLPAYAYGAGSVIWIAGCQKIVKDRDEAFSRIYQYSLKLEQQRSMQAYGTGSAVNKILIINSEAQLNRITLILVKEVLGF